MDVSTLRTSRHRGLLISEVDMDNLKGFLVDPACTVHEAHVDKCTRLFLVDAGRSVRLIADHLHHVHIRRQAHLGEFSCHSIGCAKRRYVIRADQPMMDIAAGLREYLNRREKRTKISIEYHRVC